MQYLSILALAGVAYANPLAQRGLCTSDSCLAAVTGKAALGDDKLRADHCKSYLATTVTPEAVTVTSTIIGIEAPTAAWGNWKREEVIVCPNEVPNYASACKTQAYSSACSCFGYSADSTTTLTRKTIIKTVYTNPTGTACPGNAKATVTVTVTEGKPAMPTQTCLSQKQVDAFVDAFIDFLENTNRPVAGQYNETRANETFTENFTDISDSINFLAQYPLGTTTFPNRAAFNAGQGYQYPVGVVSLNTWLSCKSFTWRYKLITQQGANLPVQGINLFEVTDDLTRIKANYAEFNSGAWLQNLGNPQCAQSTSSP